MRLKGIKVVTKPDGRRYVYRRTPGGLVPLPDLPENDPRFLKAYADAAHARPARHRAAEGSIAALCAAYLASADYRALAPSTRAVRRRLLDRIAAERGAGRVADLRPEHLRKDVRRLTPGAAQMRLKAWRSLCRFALEEGWRSDDPSREVRAPRGETKPHRQWTAEEIARFRAHWPVGTSERAAMEVIYWTAARCVDAVTLGWHLVDAEGWLTFTQRKTGQPVTLPVTAPLPSWAARAAGLEAGCTAHGLRKARASAVAEAGASASPVGAWIGDVSLSMAAHYTRAADRRAILAGPEQDRNPGNRTIEFPKERGE